MSLSGASPLPAGHRIAARYAIEAVLGRGHSATVYRALDERTGTLVALKILAAHLLLDAVATERFRREAIILQQLAHPNVIKVYGLERDGDMHFIVMEYFDAGDCKRFLEQSGRMTIGEAVALGKTVAQTLEACHRLQIVHRDLKPQNLLRNSRGELKLVDFGVAKMQTQSDLTRTGTMFGTPQYLAPELFQSARADPRSDLYSLGAVLYECLTGRPPFPATTLGAVLAQQMRNAIEPLSSLRPEVPQWLAAAVHKCLRLDPARRYQSAHALWRDLELGEQGGALREERVADEACRACQAQLLLGLPFCPACGNMRDLVLEPGNASVVITRCDTPRPLASYLAQQFQSASSQRIEEALGRLPAVLCRGVSLPTARSLVRQLSAFACEPEVAEWRWSALQVPMTYAAVGLALVLPLFAIADRISPLQRVAVILLAEAAVLGLYAWRTRPILPLVWRTRRVASAVDRGLVEPWAKALPGVRDANLRMILAHIVGGYLAVHERLRRSTLPIRAEVIAPAVQAALAAARVLERQEVYLSGASLSEMHGRLRSAGEALARTETIEQAAGVIRVRAASARDVQDFEVLQEQHTDLYLTLFNLQVTLQRLDEALASGNGAVEALSELRDIAQQLRGAEAPQGK